MTTSRATPCMLAFDPDPATGAALKAALANRVELHLAADAAQARAVLAERDVVAAFVGLGDSAFACAALGMLARDWPDTVRVAVGPVEDRAAFAAEAAGADAHLPTPLRDPLARIAARAAEALFAARRETDLLHAERDSAGVEAPEARRRRAAR